MLDSSTPIKYEFVKTLINILPNEFSKNATILFCGPTGADAIEAAIKLFKIHTGNEGILCFSGGFHGMTYGALSISSNSSIKSQLNSFMPYVYAFPFPNMFYSPYCENIEKIIDESINCLGNFFDSIENTSNKPAAVIIEIIQGEGGIFCVPIPWIKKLRALTEHYNIPLVIDEIQTGIGRTGKMFSFEDAGIIPDAITLSKAIGGGFPLSLLVYNKKYDNWKAGSHSGTFRGNQIAMIAGNRTIQYIVQNKICLNVLDLGKWFIDKLINLKNEFSIIREVRGEGFMIGIEIINLNERDCFGRYQNDGEMARKIANTCFENGLIIECCGPKKSVLKISPPLIVNKDTLDKVYCILYETIKECISIKN